MSEKISGQDRLKQVRTYFSKKDWGVIIFLSVIVVLFGYFGLPYIVPALGGAGFVHGMLKLPGPGAGVVMSSAFVCFWLVLGLIITRKPGTMLTMSLLITLIRILWAVTIGIIQTDPHNAVAAVSLGDPMQAIAMNGVFFRLNVIPIVAMICEAIYLLPVDRKPWRYVFPSCIALLGLIIVTSLVTGQTTTGEGRNAAASSVFPIGYIAIAILGFSVAVGCYMYPVKYFVCAGVGNLYYILHYWLFWGKDGFATRFPVLPAIPILVLYALVMGVLLAMLAYGIYLLLKVYLNKDISLMPDQ